MKFILPRLIFILACILAISIISNYHLPEFKDSNWETVLFLTPFGIIWNRFSGHEALRSFYSDHSPGQVSSGFAPMAGIAFLQVFLMATFLRLKKNK